MGCGIFPSLAQAPALATGPALKQEERKCPVSGGRRGRADATACAVPSGVAALAQDLPWGSSSSRAPRKLLPCGETQGTAQAGQEEGGSLGPVSPGN